MIEDDPDWKVTTNLFAALYRHHPIRVSVAGSVESISHITAETLYACHKAFYDPANMVLCVAGNVDPARICQVAREILPAKAGPIAEKDYGPEEPAEVAQSRIEQHMAVSTPIFQLGYKGDPMPRGVEGLRQRMVADLAIEALLGESTPLYARLYEQGLINRNFSYGCESYPGCAFLMAGGESKDPDAVRETVAREAARLAREGIDPVLWERLKKGMYGARVRGLNSFENLCVGQAQAYFEGCDFLDFAGLFRDITREDAQRLLACWVTPGRTALSVVWPREEEENG